MVLSSPVQSQDPCCQHSFFFTRTRRNQLNQRAPLQAVGGRGCTTGESLGAAEESGGRKCGGGGETFGNLMLSDAANGCVCVCCGCVYAYTRDWCATSEELYLELGSMERAGERGGERKRKRCLKVEDWPALPDQLCCGRLGRGGQGEVPLANGCVNYIAQFRRSGRWANSE